MRSESLFDKEKQESFCLRFHECANFFNEKNRSEEIQNRRTTKQGVWRPVGRSDALSVSLKGDLPESLRQDEYEKAVVC